MKTSKNFGYDLAIGSLLAFAIFPAAFSMPKPSTEFARVNGKVITFKEVQRALEGVMNEGQRDTYLSDELSRKQVLENLVEQELLSQQAEKVKLTQDKEYLEAMETFKRQYLSGRLIEKEVGPQVTPKAAMEYYKRNKAKFNTDQVHAWHILATTEEEAQDLLKKAQAEGADFQALAEKHSRDPSAKNNRGDLGFFMRDKFVPEFNEAVFGVTDGSIVGPIKTLYGFHIVKVVEKKVGKTLEFTEVERRVESELRRELVRNYVSKLRQQAKVQILEKNIAR